MHHIRTSTRNTGRALLIFLALAIGSCRATAQDIVPEKQSAEWIRKHVINNPVTPDWLQEKLPDKAPRLILTPAVEQLLTEKIESDSLTSTYYRYLLNAADRILDKPLLEREKTGRRLLGVSRKAVFRIGTLAMVYRIEGSRRYLDRLNEEIYAVSTFTDWNPSHFLDVAEMSYGVAIGLDWAGSSLPDSTVTTAENALKHHLELSFKDRRYNWWITSEHNWNQVCHAGLSAAAIVLGHDYPNLAANTIARAIDHLPLALAAYAPDGAYPEGPTYWDYGTS
ncbi:MAG: hypothetical protein R3281_16690, partial [Balneolaceae bacterium]|nr:hypothetical protein [Balneolaceae bacterium]